MHTFLSMIPLLMLSFLNLNFPSRLGQAPSNPRNLSQPASLALHLLAVSSRPQVFLPTWPPLSHLALVAVAILLVWCLAVSVLPIFISNSPGTMLLFFSSPWFLVWKILSKCWSCWKRWKEIERVEGGKSGLWLPDSTNDPLPCLTQDTASWCSKWPRYPAVRGSGCRLCSHCTVSEPFQVEHSLPRLTDFTALFCSRVASGHVVMPQWSREHPRVSSTSKDAVAVSSRRQAYLLTWPLDL